MPTVIAAAALVAIGVYLAVLTRRDRPVSAALRRDWLRAECRAGWEGPTWRNDAMRREVARRRGEG